MDTLIVIKQTTKSPMSCEEAIFIKRLMSNILLYNPCVKY